MNRRKFLHFDKDGEAGGSETPPEKKDETLPEDTPDWVKKRLSEISGKKSAAEKEAADLKQKLKDREEQDAEEARKKAEEEGDFQKVNETLTEENKALKKKAEKYDKLEQKTRDAALAKIADKLGDEKAADYVDFETEQLQTVANTFINQAEAPPPDDSRGGSRDADETTTAALKKYGSKNMLARLNPDLYRKLYPNPRRRNG